MYFHVFGLIVNWFNGNYMIFRCLDLFLRCLDLYFIFWTYILTVWTYILGFWTYILGFGLIFGCLDLLFRCLNLYFRSPGRVGSVGSGGSGGQPGRVSSTFEGKSILGICIEKKEALIIYWLLNFRSYRAEISHMRSIQGRKPKLIIWVVSQFNFWKGSSLFGS